MEFARDKIKKRNSLPFPAASEAFYQKQGYLSQHNGNRTKYRANFPVQKNVAENVGVNRSHVAGSLAENIIQLQEQSQGLTQLTKSGTRSSLACIKVAEELKRCMFLKTSDAYHIFKTDKTRNCSKVYTDYYRSVDAYETLAKYLNIAQIYIGQTGYIV